MAENRAAVINWYGPYRASDTSGPAKVAADNASSNLSLYAAIGHGKRFTRGPTRLLYVGLSADLQNRLSNPHHKLDELHVSEIWLGEIAVDGVPGRRTKKTAPHPDFAEWMLLYFLQPPGNTKKKTNPPLFSGVIVNRWWLWDIVNDEWTSTARPNSRWADIIEYDSYMCRANLVWFGAKPRVRDFQVPLKIRGAE